MKSKYFLQLIIFSFMLLVSFKAYATPVPTAEAQKWAEQTGNLLIETLASSASKEKFKQLDSLLLENVDLDYIGKFVVGKYWREMNKTQQQTYLELFKRYSLAVYKNYPLNFSKDEIRFIIGGVKNIDKFTNVNALIIVKNKAPQSPENQDFRITAEFQLHKVNGKIKLTDLKVAESSMLISYRARFQQMLVEDDGEISWFLEDLELVTSSNEKANEEKLRN